MNLRGLFGSLPLEGTSIARSWDDLYVFLVGLSVFFFVLVVGGMLWFAWKYRDRAGHKSEFVTGHFRLEIIWTVVPTVMLLGIFGWGWMVYKKMIQAPGDAMTVRVLGKQWLWNFQYDDGRVLTNELYVPVNRPVRLLMTSEDVLHSFFIPNFRVKSDVVPGMYTQVWFEAKVAGSHQVFCAEYCGAAHSDMMAKIHVLEPAAWEAFRRGHTPVLAQQTGAATGNAQPLSLAEQGKKLTQLKGCVACHTEDGTTRIGPSYKGLFGSKVEFADGSTAVADENYIRASIENPQAKIVKGFPSSMPTYKGLLSDSEVNAVVEYIKSVK
jgi:cytochrome c oxidase subunit 2